MPTKNIKVPITINNAVAYTGSGASSAVNNKARNAMVDITPQHYFQCEYKFRGFNFLFV